MTKKIMMSLVTVLFVTGALFVTPQAHAAGPNSGGGNYFSGLIQFISQKFGLDKTQVQSAVNEYHSQRKANITPRTTMSPQDMQAREQKRLDGLVSQGKITADQEKTIIAELASIKTTYDPSTWKDLSPADRKSKMDAMQQEIKTWAQSQNIDPQYVLGMGGFRGNKMGGPKNWGNK